MHYTLIHPGGRRKDMSSCLSVFPALLSGISAVLERGPLWRTKNATAFAGPRGISIFKHGLSSICHVHKLNLSTLFLKPLGFTWIYPTLIRDTCLSPMFWLKTYPPVVVWIRGHPKPVSTKPPVMGLLRYLNNKHKHISTERQRCCTYSATLQWRPYSQAMHWSETTSKLNFGTSWRVASPAIHNALTIPLPLDEDLSHQLSRLQVTSWPPPLQERLGFTSWRDGDFIWSVPDFIYKYVCICIYIHIHTHILQFVITTCIQTHIN